MEATKCGGAAVVMVATIQLPPNTNDDAWPAIGGPKLAFRRQDLTLVLLQNR